MHRHDSRGASTAHVLPEGVYLPEADVRMWLNERAVRGWTESWRRTARLIGLLTSDTLMGMAGVYSALSTWEVVSANGARPLPYEVPLLAMVVCLQPLALRVFGAYDGGRARTRLGRVVCGVTLAALLGWIQARLFGQLSPELPNKVAYLYSAIWICLYVWPARLVLDRLIAFSYDQGFLQRHVLVVGSADEAEDLYDRCSVAGSEHRIVGRLAANGIEDRLVPRRRRDGGDRVPFMGELQMLQYALSKTGAQSIIVASNLPFANLEALVSECFTLGATVSVLPQVLKRISNAQIEIRRSHLGSLLQLRPLKLELPQLAVKRTMDVVLTTLGLAVAWPVFAAIAVAIKMDSRGPVLFRQTRIGVGGRRFEILKFRTMVVDAEKQKAALQHLNEYGDARLFKIKQDPRITRLGRFLRRSSLDELPQLWNVLRGDMSLVGPRPCVPEEFAQYAAHHMERLYVVPGVTGLWQVSGRSEITDFEQVVKLDQEYIRSWSLTHDLVILAKTLPSLLNRGAY